MKICIPSYHLEESKVVYEISILDGSRWSVNKRYSEFETLYKQLKEYFDVPKLPSKRYVTFLVGKSEEQIEERREGLQEFLKSVCQQHIIDSIILRQFLEIDQHKNTCKPAQLICEYKGFMHGVRDFCIDLDNQIMFIINSDCTLGGRLDAYLQNYRFPWESKQVIPVGCLECWVQNDSEYEKNWVKMYKSQAISCYHTNNQFVVGLDNGHVNYLKLDNGKYIESIDIEQHRDRVMGLYIQDNNIHSVSKDMRYRVLNLESESLLLDKQPSDFELSNLLISEKKGLSFVADICGSIFVFDLKTLTAIVHLSSRLREIRGMAIDNERGYLLAVGFQEGLICIFDVQGKSSQWKHIHELKNKQGSRELCWSQGRGEVFVGNQDGTVTVWDAKKKSPIYIIKAHDQAITRLVWLEAEATLMTGSKDKTIRAWRLPRVWTEEKPDEMTLGLRLQDIESWNNDQYNESQ